MYSVWVHHACMVRIPEPGERVDMFGFQLKTSIYTMYHAIQLENDRRYERQT